MTSLILSPHRDDAAFSCGLLLQSLLASGADIVIVNICTVSDYAPYLGGDGSDRIGQVTTARAAEDAVFARRLIADTGAREDRIKFVDLGWQDAPIRWGVESEQVVKALPVRSAEKRDLAERLRKLPMTELVFPPLALGGHVDHLLVRAAAVEVFAEDKLLFYEDLPYACRMSPAEMANALAEDHIRSREGWSPVRAGVSGTKRNFASCYPSQIAPEVSEEMECYAEALGGRERFYGKPETLRKIEVALGPHGVQA